MPCSDAFQVRSWGAYLGLSSSIALSKLEDDLDKLVVFDPLYTKSGSDYYYDGVLLSLFTGALRYNSETDEYESPLAYIHLPFTNGPEKDVYGYRGNRCTFSYSLGDGTPKTYSLDIPIALGDYADDDGCFWMPVSYSNASRKILSDQIEYYENLNACCLDDCW